MEKITSIDPSDWMQEMIRQRDPDMGTEELIQCITAFDQALQRLALSFPGCVAVGMIANGTALGTLALATSRDTVHLSPIAPHRARTLAQIVALLPRELRAEFEDEQARAAQAAADEGEHST
jgi:hypothetical protein